MSIEAVNEKDAEAKARKMGLIVASVYPSTIQDAASKLDALIEEKATIGNSHTISDAPLRTLPPRSLQNRIGEIPNYTGLKIVHAIMHVQALFLYVAAIFSIGIGIIVVVKASTREPAFEGLQAVLTGIGLAVAGGIAHGIAEACNALRDIARNSFNFRG